jgi:hypothetical protein
MQQNFTTETTKDEIVIILIKKSHKAIFKLKTVDDITQHIKLVSAVDTFLKKEDIKWVELGADFEPVVPPNTVSFKNKYNDNIMVHISDFERFYLANVTNFIKLYHVYCDNSKVSEDGWIKVSSGHKKEKREKYDKIMTDLNILVGDWNNLIN